MSEDDQDKLIGKAYREREDAQKQLALITRELDSISEALYNLVTELRNRPRLPNIHDPSPFTIHPNLSKYIDCGGLVGLLDQQSKLIESVIKLNALLNK
jgi:hypothetical protein